MAFYDTSKSRYLTQKALGDLNSIANSKIKASQAFAAEMMNINNQATRDFQNLVKTTAQDVKEYIQEENAKKDFIAGLEALGAKESLINAAKSSTSSRGMKEIVGLGMTEDKHTPNSQHGGTRENKLTGEITEYGAIKNPLDDELKKAQIDYYNRREIKKEYLNQNQYGAGIADYLNATPEALARGIEDGYIRRDKNGLPEIEKGYQKLLAELASRDIKKIEKKTAGEALNLSKSKAPTQELTKEQKKAQEEQKKAQEIFAAEFMQRKELYKLPKKEQDYYKYGYLFGR